MSAAVVADGSAHGFGKGIDGAHEVVQRFLRQIGGLLQRRVQVVDVGLMVLSVMDFHGLRVDVRLERGEVVGKRWKCKSHFRSPGCSRSMSEYRAGDVIDRPQMSPLSLRPARWRLPC